jgi:cell wall-associated NlpC family hydrolase
LSALLLRSRRRRAIPHGPRAWNAVAHVSLADIQPGDLLSFYPGITRVGIYIGNGLMVNAARPGTVVRIETYTWFGPVMGIGRPS